MKNCPIGNERNRYGNCVKSCIPGVQYRNEKTQRCRNLSNMSSSSSSSSSKSKHRSSHKGTSNSGSNQHQSSIIKQMNNEKNKTKDTIRKLKKQAIAAEAAYATCITKAHSLMKSLKHAHSKQRALIHKTSLSSFYHSSAVSKKKNKSSQPSMLSKSAFQSLSNASPTITTSSPNSQNLQNLPTSNAITNNFDYMNKNNSRLSLYSSPESPK